MGMFDPKTEYDITFKSIPIYDFHEYKEEFVTRPPYQRKTVWSRKKQQDLLDSMFRRYYVPRIVIRLIRLDEDRTLQEIIDGQQRITTAQLFLSDKLTLPKTLSDIDPSLPGKHYSELPTDIRRFVNRDLVYDADIVKGIDDPKNPEHQRIATEIFWRLQQGESLNYMEIAHARLSSLSRNFITKYADDISFDFTTYSPIDDNSNKHPAFNILNRKNDRMQHLSLMTRLLILEENGGPGDLRDVQVSDYIERYQVPEGIDNLSFEKLPHAKQVLRVLDMFYAIFKDDPMVIENGGTIRELSVEYFIISIYMLLAHLLKYYVFDSREQALFRQFVLDFHARWRERRELDTAILAFSDSRQHSISDVATRFRIIRQLFFEYAQQQTHQMLSKDERRAFNEAERIAIYRRDNGRCQICIQEGKPDKECIVPWNEYEADHVLPHSKGGPTAIENAQLLCRYHNQQKSNHL
jgi:hypothetical protein